MKKAEKGSYMIIDKEIVKKNKDWVHFHDCVVMSVVPDFKKGLVKIYIEDRYKEGIPGYTAIFKNMLHFEMTNYAPWGASQYIDCFYFLDEPIGPERLEGFVKAYRVDDYPMMFERVKTVEDTIINPCFSLLSGDSICILCTEIEIKHGFVED